MPPQKSSYHASRGDGHAGFTSSTRQPSSRNARAARAQIAATSGSTQSAKPRSSVHATRQPFTRSAERAPIIHAVGRQRVLIALVGPGARLQHQRGVGHRARHRPRVREAPGAAGRVDRHASERGLEADDARAGRGNPDRAAAVGADVERAEPGGGRRRGAAARAARASGRDSRIARDPEEEVVRGADPAEVGVLVLPSMMPPAAFIRATIGASSVGTLSR